MTDLLPTLAEIALALIVLTGPFLVTTSPIGVASFRRSRCLSGYSAWTSAGIAVLSMIFSVVWLISWMVRRDEIAARWDAYRAERGRTPVAVG